MRESNYDFRKFLRIMHQQDVAAKKRGVKFVPFAKSQKVKRGIRSAPSA